MPKILCCGCMREIDVESEHMGIRVGCTLCGRQQTPTYRRDQRLRKRVATKQRKAEADQQRSIVPLARQEIIEAAPVRLPAKRQPPPMVITPQCPYCQSFMEQAKQGNLLANLHWVLLLLIGGCLLLATPYLPCGVVAMSIALLLPIGGRRSRVWRCLGCRSIFPRA
jgi:hypothetical protein